MSFNTRAFTEWKKGLTNKQSSLHKEVRVPVKVKVEKAPSVNLDKIIMDFAVEFMQKAFIETFLKPAFLTGNGLPGFEGYRGDAVRYAPKIEVGMDAYGEETFNRQTGFKDRRSGIERQIDKAALAGNWEAVERLQKRQAKQEENVFNRDHDAMVHARDITSTWTQGFDRMLEALTTLNAPRKEGNSIVIGMGPANLLMQQKLGQYPVTQGASSPSAYDSFFYAAEFGTGIAENVGGPQWIRHEVKGKQKEKVTHDGKDGHWWFGHPTSKGQWTGGLFSGQKGLHFLFEPTNRQPRHQFQDWITVNAKKELSKFLAYRLKR